MIDQRQKRSVTVIKAKRLFMIMGLESTVFFGNAVASLLARYKNIKTIKSLQGLNDDAIQGGSSVKQNRKN